MALPTKTQIETLDWSASGAPYASVAAKSTIDLDGIEFSSIGAPWWGVEAGASFTTYEETISQSVTLSQSEAEIVWYLRELQQSVTLSQEIATDLIFN